MLKHSRPRTRIAFAFLFVLFVSPADAFAAKKQGGSPKRKNKQASASSTTKGFGAPPPNLDDLLSTFKTRIPETDPLNSQRCPCGSSKSYGECCSVLHTYQRPCLTMTDVLRSRYSAFSYRNIDYVMKTTHKTCRDHREDKIAWAKDLNKGGMFDSFEFVNLEIGPEEPSANNDENEGFITFKVTLKARVDNPSYSTLAGQETKVSERSRFIREDGIWSYASGDVQSDAAGLEDTKLNA